jgi:hypothetical protein
MAKWPARREVFRASEAASGCQSTALDHM